MAKKSDLEKMFIGTHRRPGEIFLNGKASNEGHGDGDDGAVSSASTITHGGATARWNSSLVLVGSPIIVGLYRTAASFQTRRPFSR